LPLCQAIKGESPLSPPPYQFGGGGGGGRKKKDRNTRVVMLRSFVFDVRDKRDKLPIDSASGPCRNSASYFLGPLVAIKRAPRVPAEIARAISLVPLSRSKDGSMQKSSAWGFTIPSGLCKPVKGRQVRWYTQSYTVHFSEVKPAAGTFTYPHQTGVLLAPKAITQEWATRILRNIGARCINIQKLEEIGTLYKPMDLSVKRTADEALSPRAEGFKKPTIESVFGTGPIHRTYTRPAAEIKGFFKPIISNADKKTDSRTLCDIFTEEDNMRNYMKVIRNFNIMVTAAINKNGIDTHHKAFVGADKNDQGNAIMCIALLPELVNRSRLVDNIPGLWFHGPVPCGKSFLFTSSEHYKTITKKDTGYSPYSLESNQSGYIFDDVDPSWLATPPNSHCIRALALGDRVTDHNNNDHRGFVVVTSKEAPYYLTSVDITIDPSKQFYLDAWKRRIVSLQCDALVDYDPINVDFRYRSLEIIARQAFEMCYKKLKSQHLIQLFARYHNHIHDHWTEADVTLYDKVFDQPITINN